MGEVSVNGEEYEILFHGGDMAAWLRNLAKGFPGGVDETQRGK